MLRHSLRKSKSRRPEDTNFKQQRLPAWQPILTANTFLPLFFIVGFFFIPFGGVLLYLSASVNEKAVDYTDCRMLNHSGTTCLKYLADNVSESCECEVDFQLDYDFKPNVFMYYGLANFYQNHRLYVKSRDDEQLMGIVKPSASSHCAPFLMNGEKTIFPCGAIANSMFNDTLTLRFGEKPVPLLNTGIAWPSDIKHKFHNPPGDLRATLQNFSKPLYWQKELWELDPHNSSNNGLENEDFIVWMRTSSLPNFRKLYRRVDHSHGDFKHGLERGSYTLHVIYRFPVDRFNGRKSMLLSTTTAIGGRNHFLGIAFFVVGCICLFIGFTLLLFHFKCAHRLPQVLHSQYQTSRISVWE